MRRMKGMLCCLLVSYPNFSSFHSVKSLGRHGREGENPGGWCGSSRKPSSTGKGDVTFTGQETSRSDVLL